MSECKESSATDLSCWLVRTFDHRWVGLITIDGWGSLLPSSVGGVYGLRIWTALKEGKTFSKNLTGLFTTFF